MKGLTKLWLELSDISCDKQHCIITNRLFWQELKDGIVQEPIYLAINTLSGAIDLFTENEGKQIEGIIFDNKWNELSNRVFNYLLERGYIFPSKEIEELVFDTFVKDYKNREYANKSILASFALDTSCPMKCEYCFEKKQLEQGEMFEHSMMDEETLKSSFEFLNMISTLQGRRVDYVSGYGGEPLQVKNYDINRLFIDLAKKNGYRISYFSNLALLDKKLIDLLIDNSSHMNFIQVTLDDIGEAHNATRGIPNAFEKTVNNIDQLLKGNVPIVVRSNIGEHNIDSLPKIAKFYEDKGWFKFPNFKGCITPTYDRHHDFTKSFTLDEEIGVSKYLKYREEYESVRKIAGLKFGPTLENILEAFKIREETDIRKNDFMISIKPTISYCYTSNRAEYVFTGKPDCSIYNCAECVGIKKLRLGQYYPYFKIDEKQADLWGMKKGSINDIRSIDKLEKCKKCKASTYCGGFCALEAISTSGTAHDVYCKRADKIIKNFLNNESERLYKRAKMLIESNTNITL